MKMKSSCVLSLPMLLATACAATVQDGPADSTPEGMLTSTRIEIGADGVVKKTISYMTPAEMQAEIEGRKQAEALRAQGILATYDSKCAEPDMWIYDGLNATGNRICFAGSSTDQLGLFCHSGNIDCIDNWDTAARSFWSGVSGGRFEPWSGFGCSDQFFGVWGPITNFACAGHVNKLHQLNPNCEYHGNDVIICEVP